MRSETGAPLAPRTTSTTARGAAQAATGAGTRRLAERFSQRFTEDFYRPLTRDLLVASIGVGTYLGECTDEEDARYESTVHAALAAGCTVVDTAINYRCQRAERAVGRAVARALADGVVRRDEVVLCTKGGFVALDGEPPATREAYDAFLERELFAPGVLAPHELALGGHSLAPRFLEDAIARSRANLGVDTIDVYYLHEPERQRDARRDALDGDAFATVLRRAAEVMEAAVSRGEIARWGVATWRGLRVAPGMKGHLALRDVVAAARDVAGGAHHLAVVQMPINLAMPEAVRAATQPLAPRDGVETRLVPALQAAQELGLAVVASAPLMQGKLTAGLPSQLRETFPGCESDAQRALTFARGLPGVSAAVVGMRSTEHLAENLRSAR